MLPAWKAQVTSAHDLGVPVFFHSDGNLNAVLPLIVEAGFDGLQCLEPGAGMDIRAIKAQYGEALCLMGNVDPASLNPSFDETGSTDTTDVLERAVGHIMASADGRGGLIFGTCSGLHSGMQPDRVSRMYRLASGLDPAAQSDPTED
jgi:uroporphyrinogen decarboxylase